MSLAASRLPRVPFVRTVHVAPLSQKGARFEGLVAQNLSLGGVFVECSNPPAPGTAMLVAFERDREKFIAGFGEVVWCKQAEGEAQGFGLKFTRLGAATRAFVETVVKHGGLTARRSSQPPS